MQNNSRNSCFFFSHMDIHVQTANSRQRRKILVMWLFQPSYVYAKQSCWETKSRLGIKFHNRLSCTKGTVMLKASVNLNCFCVGGSELLLGKNCIGRASCGEGFVFLVGQTAYAVIYLFIYLPIGSRWTVDFNSYFLPTNSLPGASQFACSLGESSRCFTTYPVKMTKQEQ